MASQRGNNLVAEHLILLVMDDSSTTTRQGIKQSFCSKCGSKEVVNYCELWRQRCPSRFTDDRARGMRRDCVRPRWSLCPLARRPCTVQTNDLILHAAHGVTRVRVGDSEMGWKAHKLVEGPLAVLRNEVDRAAISYDIPPLQKHGSVCEAACLACRVKRGRRKDELEEGAGEHGAAARRVWEMECALAVVRPMHLQQRPPSAANPNSLHL